MCVDIADERLPLLKAVGFRSTSSPFLYPLDVQNKPSHQFMGAPVDGSSYGSRSLTYRQRWRAVEDSELLPGRRNMKLGWNLLSRISLIGTYKAIKAAAMAHNVSKSPRI